jgi:hypothetical protein
VETPERTSKIDMSRDLRPYNREQLDAAKSERIHTGDEVTRLYKRHPQAWRSAVVALTTAPGSALPCANAVSAYAR